MYSTSKALLALTVSSVATSILAAPASAQLFTPTQSQTFFFNTLDQTQTLTFNGFDASLGILTDFHIAISFDATLDSTVFNTTGGNASVGSPTPVTATSTITAAVVGLPGVSVSESITTPGFTGTVGPNQTTVGTESVTGASASMTFFDPPFDLSALIGGVQSVDVDLSAIGSQGGSVPGGVFTGNNGTADVTVEVFYSYELTGESVPEPGTIVGLVAVGVAGLASRLRNSKLEK